MTENTKKLFLDQDGLSTFWGIIKDNFAKKDNVVDASTLNFISDQASVKLQYSKANGEVVTPINIPVASDTKAGVIDVATFNKINAMSGEITNAIKIDDFKLVNSNNGDELTSIIKDKTVALKLAYESDSANGTAAIKLVDANNENVYSAIDVSDLIKTGLLKDADIVVNPGGRVGTYLKLVFNIGSGDDTRELFFNVSDLIDIYEPASNGGISITDHDYDSESDDQPARRFISLKLAADTERGGIKIGFTKDENARKYPVELDNEKAYVNIPWKNIISENNNHILISDDDSNSNNVKLSLGQDVTDAITKANSAMSSIVILGTSFNKDNNTVDSNFVKNQLRLKGSAYTDYINTENDLKNVSETGKLVDAHTIKKYVDDAVDSITGDSGYTQAITSAINELDSSVEAGTSGESQLFFTKIAITDGKLDTDNSGRSSIAIKDITDFGIMDEDTIKDICTFD